MLRGDHLIKFLGLLVTMSKVLLLLKSKHLHLNLGVILLQKQKKFSDKKVYELFTYHLNMLSELSLRNLSRPLLIQFSRLNLCLELLDFIRFKGDLFDFSLPFGIDLFEPGDLKGQVFVHLIKVNGGVILFEMLRVYWVESCLSKSHCYELKVYLIYFENNWLDSNNGVLGFWGDRKSVV
jgi:hypothetical protein